MNMNNVKNCNIWANANKLVIFKDVIEANPTIPVVIAILFIKPLSSYNFIKKLFNLLYFF